MEASSTIDRIVPYVEYYTSDITVAHPMKLKVISQSMKKTDRNDAHILLELDRLGYVPESYLPPVDSGDQGVTADQDLCKNAGLKLTRFIYTFLHFLTPFSWLATSFFSCP